MWELMEMHNVVRGSQERVMSPVLVDDPRSLREREANMGAGL